MIQSLATSLGDVRHKSDITVETEDIFNALRILKQDKDELHERTQARSQQLQRSHSIRIKYERTNGISVEKVHDQFAFEIRQICEEYLEYDFRSTCASLFRRRHSIESN